MKIICTKPLSMPLRILSNICEGVHTTPAKFYQRKAMEKQLWVVYFESANYAGYGEHCLVWATDKEDAESEVSGYAEDFYYEQDQQQYEEEYGTDDSGVMWSTIMDIYPLASDAAKDVREYLLDDVQKRFYPIINEK